MSEAIQKLFEHGAPWLRVDFHLHTRADKEFRYGGEENQFINNYVDALESTGTRLAVITNHNKFDYKEFKALRKRARNAGIGVLPGVELSVNDGANGIHTLIVFSDAWLADGYDYINQFLNVAFSGRVPQQYENENGRSKDDLVDTLKELERYNRDFFILFAHVENNSGLWREIRGGRMEELASDPLVQKYTLGFQKVRTHDKPDAVCRVKVKGWWGERYPAEVEGSDAKSIDQIGKGQKTYLKLGDLSFDAVKFALTDHKFRVSKEAPSVNHSHIKAIRFEGGVLKDKRVTFSPHLNCLIGIQGSGKSSILESIRYGLDIPFGEMAQDKDYKDKLVPHVLKSGGKIVLEVVDRHGRNFEISRIHGQSPNVYVDGFLRPGISIGETVITKPLYFGQKDLSAVGSGFGNDLVDKLIGSDLKGIRQKIKERTNDLSSSISEFMEISSDVNELEALQTELNNLNFKLEQFDKHGLKEKLEKQLVYYKDLDYCENIEETARDWQRVIDRFAIKAEEEFNLIEDRKSDYNFEFFIGYTAKLRELKSISIMAKAISAKILLITSELDRLHQELRDSRDSLKEEFAETERNLVVALEQQGVSSIEPDAYIQLTQRKQELEAQIAEVTKRTQKKKSRFDAVEVALASVNDAWHEEFLLISGELEKINKSQTALKVEAEFSGDKKAFKDRFEQVLRGSGIRREHYENLAAAYPNFGEVFRDLDSASTLAKTKSEDFKNLFLANLYALLSYQVPNSYSVTYHGKALSSHSLGQRASAMMLFLLSQEGNDLLLIDQPEDDLDSQTVYEEVVKLLRKLKPDRQFIFATHNANFPVLGDSETITTCSATDEEISVSTGNIDDKACQTSVISIMEGGPEAFDRRKTIYQIWKADAN
ncbi:TrlF family AAA-like ATPase [Palleronia sp. LCG004]|uniref:TrlF family AAA-like ATPase n=1 Tax=Palleronia sp. LCG004 TaxID=3079304 RepID=UPI0029439571|nr:AAA family ATPase [Palleronia sp. LCG004]WOI56082.1 hypothetical protein RVY76_13765 [Palleronia sp. LCG004]